MSGKRMARRAAGRSVLVRLPEAGGFAVSGRPAVWIGGSRRQECRAEQADLVAQGSRYDASDGMSR